MTDSKDCIVCGKTYFKKVNCSRKNRKKSTCCSKECNIKVFSQTKSFLGKKHSEKTKSKIREKLLGTGIGNTNGFKKGGIPRNKGKYGYQVHGGFIKTRLQITIRTCVKFLERRKKVFEKDDYTCQDCGIKSAKGTGRVKLHAHHKKAFSEILQQHSIQSFDEAMNCKELRDTTNGQTLCKDCHKKTDSYKLNQYSR